MKEIFPHFFADPPPPRYLYLNQLCIGLDGGGGGGGVSNSSITFFFVNRSLLKFEYKTRLFLIFFSLKRYSFQKLIFFLATEDRFIRS